MLLIFTVQNNVMIVLTIFYEPLMHLEWRFGSNVGLA
jgi:hypothetical protein